MEPAHQATQARRGRRRKPQRPLFSVHIMKTGGMTLRAHLQRAVGNDHLYPLAGAGNVLREKVSMDALAEACAGDIDRFWAFHVHQPYVAHRLVGRDVTTLTVLRDPVDRSVSALRQMARRLGRTPEEIYERPWLRDRLFVDHQVRVLGLDDEDAADWRSLQQALLFAPQLFDAAEPGVPPPLRMDEDRLAIACRNLADVDLVGVLDRFDVLLRALSVELGRTLDADTVVNAGSGPGVSPELRARIAEDNVLDVELYRTAGHLVAERYG